MKKYLPFILFFLFVLDIASKPRTQDGAFELAASFLSKNMSIRTTSVTSKLTLAYMEKDDSGIRSSSQDNAYYYVFNVGDAEGFVIVSGDDNAREILGYSEAGAFDINKIPLNFKYWLAFYKDQIKTLNDAAELIIRKDDNRTGQVRNSFASSVAPLLGGIKWNQGDPYNLQSPTITSGTNAGKQTYTGCVATAMAQIMKYHKWPAQGTGSYSYVTRTHGFSLSAAFGNTKYNWEIMEDTYSSQSSTASIAAVSTLMFHCGVSVDMNYGETGLESGAVGQAIGISLPKYFGYDPGIDTYFRDYYTADEWINLLKSELNAQRPIFYSGNGDDSGHAFVCDGYDSNNLFHFNWGWGGYYDGYFEISALNPAGVGAGGGSGGYNMRQSIVAGIQPKVNPVSTKPVKLGYKSFDLNEIEVKLTDKFPVTVLDIENIGLEAFSGYLGLALYTENDKFIDYLSLYNFSGSAFKTGYYISTLDFTINGLPSTITSGNYKMKMIFLNSADDNDVKLITPKAGTPGYVNVKVDGLNATLSIPTTELPALELKSLKAQADLYVNRTGKITAEITNKKGGEYNSDLVLLVTPPNGYNGMFSVTEPVVIAANTTKTVEFSVTIGASYPAGEYTFSLIYDKGNHRESFTEEDMFMFENTLKVAVNAEPAPANLSLTQTVAIENSERVCKDHAVFSAKVTNSGGYYSGNACAFVFDTESVSFLTDFGSKMITLGSGETKTLTLEGSIDLPTGKYLVALFYQHNGSYTQMEPFNLSWVEFTLTQCTSGIRESDISDNMVTLYPNPATDRLYLKSEEVVNKIRITDISGKQVISLTPVVNNIIDISLEGLNPGLYLLQYETAAGIKTKKFLKK